MEWAYPGYPVGRLGAGTLSCWPARVGLVDGGSITILIFSDFQGLRWGAELSEPFCGWRPMWGEGGEHPRIKESRLLKEGRVTGLEGRGSIGGSWLRGGCVP